MMVGCDINASMELNIIISPLKLSIIVIIMLSCHRHFMIETLKLMGSDVKDEIGFSKRCGCALLSFMLFLAVSLSFDRKISAASK